MTEDDTFNKLRRQPFNEIFLKLNAYHRTSEYLNSKDQLESSTIFLNKYYWGVEEYVKILEASHVD